MFYSCLSFSRLKKLRVFWGLSNRMKQQKLTMGEVNKWAIHSEPFIPGPPALCLQIARFQPIYRDRGWPRWGGSSWAGEGTGLTLEIDGAARARLWSRALPVPCPAARFLPHYSFLNTHIGGTLFTLDSIWDSHPNMNTLSQHEYTIPTWIHYPNMNTLSQHEYTIPTWIHYPNMNTLSQHEYTIPTWIHFLKPSKHSSLAHIGY